MGVGATSCDAAVQVRRGVLGFRAYRLQVAKDVEEEEEEEEELGF